MIMNLSVNSSIEIKSLLELKVLIEELKLKVNKSQIARELGVDRRLIDKYMNWLYQAREKKKKK